jgi:hypothetical protein
VRGSLIGCTSPGGCAAALSANTGWRAAASPATAAPFIQERRLSSNPPLPLEPFAPIVFSVISAYLLCLNSSLPDKEKSAFHRLILFQFQIEIAIILFGIGIA